MINRFISVGRLTKDPDLRFTPNGVAVASFTLAVNRPFKNQNGDQDADFIPIVVWRKQAENVAEYLKKGNLAGIDGRIQTRNYENKEGNRVYVTEVMADSVQFLEPKRSNNNQQQPSSQGKPDNWTPDDVPDSELPF
jgi:single-strand DNA-binding protein